MPRSHGKSKSREYTSYCAMLQRCTNKKLRGWRYYGGRGIMVCTEWRGAGGFERFLAHVGPRPPETSLDRINSNGNYEPGNVRWANKFIQYANRNVTPDSHRRGAAHRREARFRKYARAALARFGRILGFKATEILMQEIQADLEEQLGPLAPMPAPKSMLSIEDSFSCGDFTTVSEHFGEMTWVSLRAEMRDPFPANPKGNFFSKKHRAIARLARKAA